MDQIDRELVTLLLDEFSANAVIIEMAVQLKQVAVTLADHEYVAELLKFTAEHAEAEEANELQDS